MSSHLIDSSEFGLLLDDSDNPRHTDTVVRLNDKFLVVDVLFVWYWFQYWLNCHILFVDR